MNLDAYRTLICNIQQLDSDLHFFADNSLKSTIESARNSIIKQAELNADRAFYDASTQIGHLRVILDDCKDQKEGQRI